jgi:hypothetical protein
MPRCEAFLGFWFDDLTHAQSEDADRVSGTKVFGIFSATALAHVIVWGYLCIAVYSLNYPDDDDQSFQGIVRQGFTFLAICSVLMTMPVAFILKRKVSLGEPADSLRNDPNDQIRK